MFKYALRLKLMKRKKKKKIASKLFAKLPVDELIQMSAISKTVARQIRRCQIKKFSIDIKIVGCHPHQSFARIKLPSREWIISEGEKNDVLKANEEQFRFNGIPVIKEQFGFFRTNCTGRLDETLNSVLTLLKRLFPKCQAGRLEVSLNNFPKDFKIETALSSISQVEIMEICGRGEQKESAKYLLENIQATEELSDEYPHQATDRINTFLMKNAKELLCGSAVFLRRSDLLSFNNQCITLAEAGGNVFKPEDLTDFIRRWKYSTTQEVKNFKGMKLEHRQDDLILPILNILGARMWTHFRTFYLPKVLCCKNDLRQVMTARRVCYHTLDRSRGWDIRRRDGLVMSVIPDNSRTFFLVEKNLPDEKSSPIGIY